MHHLTMSMARSLLLAVSALLLATAASGAPARNPEREAQYAAEVRDRSETFRAASAAGDAGKLEEAERGFREVLAAYPKHGPSLWRLSSVLLAQKRRDEAIAVGRQAVASRPGSASRGTLAEALMTGASAGDPALVEVDTLLADAQREAEDDSARAYVAVDLIRLALIRNNTPAFREAMDMLRLSAPDETITHYFGALERALA